MTDIEQVAERIYEMHAQAACETFGAGPSIWRSWRDLEEPIRAYYRKFAGALARYFQPPACIDQARPLEHGMPRLWPRARPHGGAS